MTKHTTSLAALLWLLCTAALPAHAASSAASSASDSVGTSVGSVSGSLQKSSGASSQGTDVAAGDYRIVEVVTLTERPGTVRMKLQALGDVSAEGELYLHVPPKALEASELVAGQTVAARQRPYGVEFANGQTRQAFFLVLADDWYRELQSHAVVL